MKKSKKTIYHEYMRGQKVSRRYYLMRNPYSKFKRQTYSEWKYEMGYTNPNNKSYIGDSNE